MSCKNIGGGKRMRLLTDGEIKELEDRLSREKDEKAKNEIEQLYKQYNVFITNQAMNNLILPKLEEYIQQRDITTEKKEFKL
jgi:hypothetical protein